MNTITAIDSARNDFIFHFQVTFKSVGVFRGIPKGV